jgi:polyisoprenoid-binding protein YceI
MDICLNDCLENKQAFKILYPIAKMKMKPGIHFINLIMALVLLPCHVFSQPKPILSTGGKVKFTSEAPLESIEATSDKLKGAIDKSKNTFAFAVEIKSFKGFNSDLQREHFDENYIETDKFPTATFSGKFIESIDYATNGTYVVRAKGMFTLHGVQRERIIKGTITINNNSILINAVFNVRLEDHDIKVPKIVYEKIAEEIKIEFNVQFKN